ncbi:GspE/PulE family protein [Pseudomonas nitroreducens]|uniref:GspE/PulE family protein n=1 Tax=Pseudomonas nitroreducens TaxID=46680 RepID=UPI00265B5EC6|nr:type II/IV secretion system protein [Pseudomonas nitroreducens]MCP1647390.1 general secretion pathway protein E [Pseudomonas nitroreducens]MCP1685966.1 general secretion pathway protein E [Pseudomonas nitroreducens]
MYSEPIVSSSPEFPALDRLGQRLVSKGLVSAEEVERALELQARIGGRLGAILMRSGALSETVLLDELADQLVAPLVGKTTEVPSAAMITDALDRSRIRPEWFLAEQVVLWESEQQILQVAARDPLEPALRDVLQRFYPGREVQWVLCRSQDLDAWLRVVDQHQQRDSWRSRMFAEDDVRHLREMAEEAPIVELVNNVIGQAIERRASDIHIEPGEFNFLVRLRIDGVLQSQLTLPRERFAAVVSRIKLISAIDIAERRLPQDGRMSIRIGGQEMDIRVSSLPGVHGESVVMRLLPKEREGLRLESLGMLPDHLAMMQVWTREPHGIVLVTGPTGSGKSTTLYGSLESINDGVRKIITVEDPVEYQVPNITQVQAHAEIGLSFAAALRSILRQDPDVIMIGEIRDLETAEIAVQSSLTGHLVFSTLHTNDAVSAFTRLIDMGVEPFLVASPIRGVQAQRLVRTLCLHCSQLQNPTMADAELLTVSRLAQAIFPAQNAGWRRAVGCSQCQGTGYRGRLGIYEMIDVRPEMQELIMQRAPVEQMRRLAHAQGYRSMREDGLIKAWMGLTSVDEVHRVTSG